MGLESDFSVKTASRNTQKPFELTAKKSSLRSSDTSCTETSESEFLTDESTEESSLSDDSSHMSDVRPNRSKKAPAKKSKKPPAKKSKKPPAKNSKNAKTSSKSYKGHYKMRCRVCDKYKFPVKKSDLEAALEFPNVHVCPDCVNNVIAPVFDEPLTPKNVKEGLYIWASIKTETGARWHCVFH